MRGDAPHQVAHGVVLVHEPVSVAAHVVTGVGPTFAYVTKMLPPMFWMPNGAYDEGIAGSTNMPLLCTR